MQSESSKLRNLGSVQVGSLCYFARRSRPAPSKRLALGLRRIAKEHNVDVSQIHGSGTGGRVTKQDILEYLERHPAGSQATPATGTVKPVAASSGIACSGTSRCAETCTTLYKYRQSVVGSLRLHRSLALRNLCAMQAQASFVLSEDQTWIV